jgi:hypothetical protein
VTIAEQAFCTECGVSLSPGVRFCAKCGAPTSVPSAETSIVESSTPIAQNPRRRQGPDGAWQYQGEDGYWYADESSQVPSGTGPVAAPASLSAPPTPPPPTPAPPQMRRTKRRVIPTSFAIIGGLIVVIGTLFLPWVTDPAGDSIKSFQIDSVKSNAYWILGLGIFVIVWTVLVLALKRESRIRRNFFFRVLDRSFIPVAILCGYGLYDSQSNISEAAGQLTYSLGVGFWAVAVGATLIFISGFFFDRGDRVGNLVEGIIDVFSGG